MPSTLLLSLQIRSYPPISSSLNPNQTSPKTFKIKNPNVSLSHPKVPVKMPTPPWISSHPLHQPHQTIDPSQPKTNKNVEKADRALTGKVSGVRGNKAMKNIIRNVENLQKDQILDEARKDLGKFEFRGRIEKVDCEEEVKGFGGKLPWLKNEKFVFRRMKKLRVVTKAEMYLDKDLLERLRNEAKKMRKWVKVKKAGVTESVVYDIRLGWRNSELVKVKFDVPLCRNMDRAREIAEFKTGGLVIWTWKDFLVIYRGENYKLTSRPSLKMNQYFAGGQETPSSKISRLNLGNKVNVSRINSNTITVDENMCGKAGEEDSMPTSIFMEENSRSRSIDRSLYEREGDRLLDGLGPRFIDWWMWKPLPVDADLLPEVVPGFRSPFRLCPPDGRSKLTDDELTYLRKLAHPLPTHFVLGRNRRLQGLAAAILKLWEKSLIAKIAVKWGIPNTDNEQMADELKARVAWCGLPDLKAQPCLSMCLTFATMLVLLCMLIMHAYCLTGGVLLLRNKFYIILYRGKDFLPSNVGNLIVEREVELKRCQLHEEGARLKAIETFCVPDEPLESSSKTGTLSEFHDIRTEFRNLEKGNGESELQFEAEKVKLERELKKQERKLYILNIKIQRSAKALSKFNSVWKPSEQDPDQELITEEERECLRKMGLKMNSCLLLGRRGVFGGVMEGLHQHWKHREVVKVITMQKLFGQVIYTAKSLVAESGGILVSVDKIKEGHAVIIYRGKNYRRPLKLRTDNLLTKRKALLRSLEMQRLGVIAEVFCISETAGNHRFESKIEPLELSTRMRKDVDVPCKESFLAVSCHGALLTGMA
ncbi:hypothetical protein Pint_18749 [Pistacia integerrima]|uniref:Uncharacterized protein n=1 Tax=Pistacia integerrima TaxID=434235 RepID=A0ACC0YWZ4_9ROSI|nr:hypothetical protein Pint_18749 [Pistacia integerrima]